MMIQLSLLVEMGKGKAGGVQNQAFAGHWRKIVTQKLESASVVLILLRDRIRG